MEWTESELCIPKLAGTNTALIAADVNNISVLDIPLQDVIHKLANLIVDWNVNYSYCVYRMSGKKPLEKNCQDFAEAIFKLLGVKFQPQGALLQFLHDMRVYGTCDLAYKPCKELRQAIPSLAESYSFKTHEELDLFVSDLNIKAGCTMKKDYPDDYNLLKAVCCSLFFSKNF